MEVPEGDVDELVEFWTLLDEDRALLTASLVRLRLQPESDVKPSA